jgi:hypothetical protein
LLNSEEMANVLYAVAIGIPGRAAEIIAASDGIDDEERKVLGGALSGGDDVSTQARRLGEALRSIGAERHLVNECYRVASYAGEDWKVLSSNPLYAFFTADRAGYPLDKWIRYFPVYERYLERYRGRPVRVLEIGLYRGGGLELLRHFLGPEARLVGIDFDKKGRAALGKKNPVEIGNLANPEFLQHVSKKHGPFDVVIDGGDHTVKQRVMSVETLFPLLGEGGTYLVEDYRAPYRTAYSRETPNQRTFIEWVKDRIDDLNACLGSKSEELLFPWQTHLDGLHVYDNVVVLTKGRQVAPVGELDSTTEFVYLDRDTGALHLELVAAREIAMSRFAEADLLIKEAVDLRKSLKELRKEHDQMCSDLQGSWGIIREMRRSMSWKATAPLRRARSAVGRRK